MRTTCITNFTFSANRGNQIISHLTKVIEKRFLSKQKEDKNRYRSMLVTRFVSFSMDKLSMENALRANIKSLPSDIRKHFNIPMVAWYYPPTLGQTLFNYKRFISTKSCKELISIAKGKCACGNSRFINKDVNHIATCDINVVEHATLRQLLGLGTKHRVNTDQWEADSCAVGVVAGDSTDPRWQALKHALDKWMKLFAEKYEVQPALLRDYTEAVMNDFETQLSKIPLESHSGINILDNTSVKKAIRTLRKKFVITYVDKFSTKFMFTCPKLYALTLLKEFMPWTLTNPELGNDELKTYELCNVNKEQLARKFGAFLRKENISYNRFDKKSNKTNIKVIPGIAVKKETGELASPCGLGKFHKPKLGWRFLACSTKYYLRALSIWLTRTFKALTPLVEQIWEEKWLKAGIKVKGTWIAKDSGRVPMIVHALNRHVKKSDRANVMLRTFDFSQMYTNIKLDALKTQMSKLFDLIFELKSRECERNIYVKIPHNESEHIKWIRYKQKDSKKWKCFDAEKLKRWFNFLVDNIYLSFADDTILRQRIGIPMGTNAAVYIANLFCFTYEYEFVARCVEKKKFDILEKFRHTLRFVDDLLSANNSLFKSYLYTSQVSDGIKGMYPPFLTLKCEQESKKEVSFLDVLVSVNKNVFKTEIYDKREHPPLSRVNQVKYPHPTCFLSKRSKYGIVTSRLHAFGRISTHKCDFISRTRIFLAIFLGRGYTRREVEFKIKGFLKKTPLAFPVPNAANFTKMLLKDLILVHTE